MFCYLTSYKQNTADIIQMATKLCTLHFAYVLKISAFMFRNLLQYLNFFFLSKLTRTLSEKTTTHKYTHNVIFHCSESKSVPKVRFLSNSVCLEVNQFSRVRFHSNQCLLRNQLSRVRFLSNYCLLRSKSVFKGEIPF